MKTSFSKRENKIETKIIRKKVKWGKRKEEQNMRIEINYNIISGDSICTNLKDKK